MCILYRIYFAFPYVYVGKKMHVPNKKKKFDDIKFLMLFSDFIPEFFCIILLKKNNNNKIRVGYLQVF